MLIADDAVLVDPEHHELLFENESTRVLRTRIGPGDRTPMHSHQWPAVLYVLSWSDVVIYGADGSVKMDTRAERGRLEVGSAIWTAPITPHRVENVGDGELIIIATEIKDAG